jgi:large subunit ribosomal protein L25
MATKTTSHERVTIIAETRALHGSRAVSRLRRSGSIPAVVYGKSLKQPASVQIPRQALLRLMNQYKGELGLVNIRVDNGTKPWEHPALIQHVEHDPVNGEITHIDFHAIDLSEKIRIRVAVLLLGTATGVKQDGGILEHFLREVEVECLPTAIPKHLEYDVAAMKIGDSIHVQDLALPEGVKAMTGADQVVASILAPKAEKAEEAVAAEAVTEPEVIREKKPKEGEEAEAPAKGGKAEAKEEKK